MLLALLTTVHAQQARVVGDDAGFALVDAYGHTLTPEQFAEAVGDERTRLAYRKKYMRMKGACWLLWGGGIGMGGSGAVALTMTPLAEQPEVVALTGVALVGLGVTSAVGGTVAYRVAKERIQDPGSWYTYDSARSWTESE